MRKFMLGLLTAFALAGCGTTSILTGGTSLTASIANPVTPAMLYDVENGMVVAVSGLLAYRNACAAGSIPASCRPIVAKLQTYTRAAKPILIQLRAFVRNNDQVNAIVAFNSVRDLLASFQTTVAINGVK